MALTPFNGPSSLRRLSDDFNRMLAQWPGFDGDNTSIVTSDWTPAVDVKEQDKAFVVTADIPGVDPNDIDVTMEGGALTIKGERSEEKKEEKEGYYMLERSSGSFYRRFVLPDTADPDSIKARSKNGVLEITIGKKEGAGTKKIAIES